MVIVITQNSLDALRYGTISALASRTIKIVDTDRGTVDISNEELLGTLKTLSLPLDKMNTEQEMLKMQEEQRKQRERSQPHRFKHKKHNYFS